VQTESDQISQQIETWTAIDAFPASVEPINGRNTSPRTWQCQRQLTASGCAIRAASRTPTAFHLGTTVY